MTNTPASAPVPASREETPRPAVVPQEVRRDVAGTLGDDRVESPSIQLPRDGRFIHLGPNTTARFSYDQEGRIGVRMDRTYLIIERKEGGQFFIRNRKTKIAVALTDGVPQEIGTDASPQLVSGEDAIAVSRRQIQVTVTGDTVEITDMGSRNGSQLRRHDAFPPLPSLRDRRGNFLTTWWIAEEGCFAHECKPERPIEFGEYRGFISRPFKNGTVTMPYERPFQIHVGKQVLRVYSSPSSGQFYVQNTRTNEIVAIGEDGIKIGREDPGVILVGLDDNTVSRHHLVVSVKEGGKAVAVTDVGSTGGTRLIK